MQTTAKGPVSSNGRCISIPRTPRDAGQNQQQGKRGRQNSKDNKTRDNETRTHGKTKNGTGHTEKPGEVGDAATPEDVVPTRKRSIEPLKDKKTGLAYSPIGNTGRATNPGIVLTATVRTACSYSCAEQTTRSTMSLTRNIARISCSPPILKNPAHLQYVVRVPADPTTRGMPSEAGSRPKCTGC